MDGFTIFVFLIYVLVIVVSLHYFTKWIEQFSGKEVKPFEPVWCVAGLAAISVPTVIINCLLLLVKAIAWLLMLF